MPANPPECEARQDFREGAGVVFYSFHIRKILEPGRLPPGQYEAFRNFLSEVARADKAKLVLAEKKT